MTMQLPRVETPHGLRPNGIVRTTGWLQIGRTPISSGLWAVLAGFFLTVPFGSSWLPFLAAALAFAGWKVWVRRLRPASRVVNLDAKPATELWPGEWVRLYGTAGPVGEVEELEVDNAGRLRVWLHGDHQLPLPPGLWVRPVELRD
ncbi:hypothetical protein [Kutzneria chonburiensis]|uniref:Uncharacterized protein n=1 Tax=Kutzneria chonburiensis TaxID=1483604 RepID=A0ABV6MXR6_9PSEU|nr:hypothetical protein [Kutzneria chonburiensis]